MIYHLCALLGASTQKSFVLNKRTSKTLVKLFVPGISGQDHHFDTSLHEQTIKTSFLLYKMKKEHIREFIYDPVNAFLVSYFSKNNGLERTDPTGEKPSCRADSLKNLLELGARSPAKILY